MHVVAQSSQSSGPSSGLSSAAFKTLVQTLDGWADVLHLGTSGNPGRCEEVEQDLQMLRAWASRLAYDLSPVQIASSKVEGSRLQQGYLGRSVKKRMLRWLCSTGTDDAPSFALRGRYTAWFAIRLKNVDMMQSALKHAIQMAFPAHLAADLLRMLDKSAAVSEATMSRWRLLFEAAACMCCVWQIASMCRAPTHRPVFHALLDSSPQGGRDWLLSELHMLGHRVAPDQMLMHLWTLCSQAGEGSEEQRRDFDAAQQALQESVEVVVLPPSGLEHQRSDVHHKVHAFVHSLWTAAGKSLPDVISCVASFATDFGTEAGISRTRAPAEIVCPQLDQDGAFQASDELAAAPDPWPLLDFTAALPVPGIHHIMHNICQDVCEQLPQFDQFKPHFQAMANFLCDPHVRQGMQERCFTQGEGMPFKERFARFSERLIDWRWQSLSAFLSAVEPLEAPLRQCWNLQAFLAASQTVRSFKSSGNVISEEPQPVEQPARENVRDSQDERSAIDAALEQLDAEVAEDSRLVQVANASEDQTAEDVRSGVRARRFDVAVRDRTVWQYMAMLRCLLKVSDELLAWFQGCPCHPKVPGSELEKASPFQTCVMKGRLLSWQQGFFSST